MIYKIYSSLFDNRLTHPYYYNQSSLAVSKLLTLKYRCKNLGIRHLISLLIKRVEKELVFLPLYLKSSLSVCPHVEPVLILQLWRATVSNPLV